MRDVTTFRHIVVVTSYRQPPHHRGKKTSELREKLATPPRVMAHTR